MATHKGRLMVSIGQFRAKVGLKRDMGSSVLGHLSSQFDRPNGSPGHWLWPLSEARRT